MPNPMKTQEFLKRPKLPVLQCPQVQIAIKFARRLRADNLLDIGCHDGEISIALKTAVGAKHVYGVELEPHNAEKAKKRGVDVIQGDVDYSDIPLPDDYCDVVFCGEVIEHVVNIDHLLDEIHRVLKPQGSCILTTPNLASWYNRLALLVGFQTYISWVPWGHFLLKGPSQPPISLGAGRPHISVMTVRALKEVITLHGFRIRRLKGASARGSPLQFPLASFFFFLDGIISGIPGLATFTVVQMEKDKSL